jgi:Icc-related predicted phosphoesterase
MVLDIIPWRKTKASSKRNDPFEPVSFPRLLFQTPVKLLLFHIYYAITSLRSSPSPSNPPVRIVCISDTHNLTIDEVPDGDVLIHAGDMTVHGTIPEIQKQVDWLASLPHKEIIVISGNHDTYLDPRTRPSLSEDGRAGAIDWKRIHYLQHRRLSLSVAVEPNNAASEETHLLARETEHRRLVVYGAPQIPACGDMSVHAFQYPRGRDAWSETVPEDVSILVTHTPPKFHMDLSLPSELGCEHLAKEVKRVKPILHVFGHVHWGAGQEVVFFDKCHDAYEEGMSVQPRWFRGLLNPWLWWNVFRVVYRGLRELIWDRVWGGQVPSTIMVNAAQMHGNTGKLGNPIQVVEI